MAEIIEIENVPPDVDPTEVGTVHNPMDEDFSCIYNRRKRVTIPAGGKKDLPLTIAIHAAKHLADRIIWKEHQADILKKATRRVAVNVPNEKGEITEKVTTEVDEKLKFELEKHPIKNYQQKLWETMKSVVKTKSRFFKDPEARRRATGRAERESEDATDEDIQDI